MPERHPDPFTAPDPYRSPYGTPHGTTWGGAYGTHGAYGRAPGPRPRNGLGLAALITGAAGAATGLTVLLSPLGAVLGVVAVVLGVLGLRRVKAGAADNRGQALAGLWTGTGAVLVSAALSVVLVVAVMDLFTFIRVTSPAGTADRPAAAGETVVYDDGFTVTAASVTAEDGGEPGTEPLRVVLALTLAHDGVETADLRDGDLEIHLDGVRVPVDAVSRPTSAPKELAPDERTTVELALWAPRGTQIVSLDYAPGLDYDYGFWAFDLSVPDGAEEPDGVTTVSL
ncbi:hypothetical protein [Streptomyces megasporus]|uniref:hypothetical protein n=1 Tax=Streptomyces megasporus TaxID=44060 RepID=UPI0004E1D82E|nr:hypothetical protein [Streptomyces megasporus]